MSIDQLIRDLIEEDKFKAKYTTRQRSIFCNNMYLKIQKFIEETNKERLDRMEELEEELETVKNDLEYYKQEILVMKKNKIVYTDLFYFIRVVLYGLYFYFIWDYYKVREEKSMKETNNSSDDPYKIA